MRITTKNTIITGIFILIAAFIPMIFKKLAPTSVYYNFPTYSESESSKSLKPSYEFYYQKMKGKPTNPDGSQNYEIGFKNLTPKPLLNFRFALQFRHPVESIEYDFGRSSANFTGGDGLSKDKKTFHWIGNQIIEDEGWVVFVIRTKNPPNIERISTKLVGKIVDTNKFIPPDPEGLRK